MARPKSNNLTQTDIKTLKGLAEVAPLLTQLVKQLVEPKDIPTEEELEHRPLPPKGSGTKQKKKKVHGDDTPSRGLRAGQSKELKKRKQKTFARRESVNIGARPNLFEKMGDFNAHKDDVKIDKALWKGKNPSSRGERTTLVEVECEECTDTFYVNPNGLKVTEEGTTYICNDCSLSRG